MLFIGDSIIRELSESFARISHGTSTKLTGVMQWDWDKKYNIQAGLERHIRDANRHGGPFGTVFVGGLGLHFLLRNSNKLIHGNGSPGELHRTMVRKYLVEWAQVSSKLSLQLIFVGTIPVEAAIIHLHPPKKDWASFYDLSLAQIWANTDGSEYQRLVDSWPSSTKLNPPLYFFDPAPLARRCGAVRCDGMHFGSHFAEWGCASSEFVWDAELADFLVLRFPDTWGLSNTSSGVK